MKTKWAEVIGCWSIVFLFGGFLTIAGERAVDNDSGEKKDEVITAPGGPNLLQNGGFESVGAASGENSSVFPGWKLIPIEAKAALEPEKLPIVGETGEKKESACAKIIVEGLSTSGHAAVLLENVGIGKEAENGAGLAVKRGTEYRLTFRAKANGNLKSLGVVLPKLEGEFLAEGKIDGLSEEWKTFEITLTPTDDYARGRLCFDLGQTGTLWLDDVSLAGTDEKK